LNESVFFAALIISSTKVITSRISRVVTKEVRNFRMSSFQDASVSEPVLTPPNIKVVSSTQNGDDPLHGTFHRRILPSPAISFSSSEGKQLFTESLLSGYMNGYFHLAEHFHTQGHPAFCGLGSLTMALNALLIDPRRVWQGMWRWFDEEMLNCCESLDNIKEKGITLAKLGCLAHCNGANVSMKYGKDISLEEFRRDIIEISKLSALENKEEGEENELTTTTESATSDQGGDASVRDSSSSTFSGSSVISPTCSVSKSRFASTSCPSCLSASSSLSNTPSPPKTKVMIVSYSRTVLSQTGIGHFSPIGGYHPSSDMVLIMDVARFKYPPHWIPLSLLYDALCTVDSETGKSRGYLLLSASNRMYCECACSELKGILNDNEPLQNSNVNNLSNLDDTNLLSSVSKEEKEKIAYNKMEYLLSLSSEEVKDRFCCNTKDPFFPTFSRSCCIKKNSSNGCCSKN
jgi:hypothetical protein